MFRIYVWIDGQSFDPTRFLEAAGGSVGSRKRMSGGVAEVSGTYWRSDEVSGVAADRVDAELRTLLRRLGPAVRAVSGDASVRVMVEVVQEYRDDDSVAGLFLSIETVRLMADMRANLDVDIVLDLS